MLGCFFSARGREHGREELLDHRSRLMLLEYELLKEEVRPVSDRDCKQRSRRYRCKHTSPKRRLQIRVHLRLIELSWLLELARSSHSTAATKQDSHFGGRTF